MSEGKHTPGPWRAQAFKTKDPAGQIGVRVLDANGVVVAEAFRQPYRAALASAEPYRVHISMPNARLMAAAPDLAEALEAFVGAPCGCTPLQRDSGHLVDCPFPALRDAAEAALTKAGRR